MIEYYLLKFTFSNQLIERIFRRERDDIAGGIIKLWELSPSLLLADYV